MKAVKLDKHYYRVDCNNGFEKARSLLKLQSYIRFFKKKIETESNQKYGILFRT